MANAEDSKLKLLGSWASPFVLRAQIALKLKSVSYEYLEESFGSKSELLLQSNPVHKKIPVLIQNDKPICESLIIVEYVDEAWSSSTPSILPSQPYDRAVARFWAAYLDDKWFPTMKSMMFVRGEEEKKALIQQLEEGIALLEDAYTKISNNKPFFGGDHIGFLDIAFGSYLGWLKATESLNGIKLLGPSKTPGLAQWAESFCADDAVKPFMPSTEKLLEFTKLLLARMAAPAST